MSGSGGYFKYRCKYWLTDDCPHWVWVNNSPCAYCLADGRDASSPLPRFPPRPSSPNHSTLDRSSSYHQDSDDEETDTDDTKGHQRQQTIQVKTE